MYKRENRNHITHENPVRFLDMIEHWQVLKSIERDGFVVGDKTPVFTDLLMQKMKWIIILKHMVCKKQSYTKVYRERRYADEILYFMSRG